MNWNSVSEFWAMGGYALYVWGSMAVVAACMLIEVALLLRRQRAARSLPLAAQQLKPVRAAVVVSSHGVRDEAAA